MNLAVLASGSGSILEAILKEGIDVSLVVTDRQCRALGIAQGSGVPAVLLDRKDYSQAFDRTGFTQSLVELLVDRRMDLVAMAGFGTILSGDLYQLYRYRVLNTHPSLLPSFPGWHAVKSALEYGVKVTGCTVHLATEAVDCGPILAQRAVEVYERDSEKTLHERIKEIERVLYPGVIRSYSDYVSNFGGSGKFAQVELDDYWFEVGDEESERGRSV